MVWMNAKKQIDENTTVEIFMSIYISRSHFYKRVEYYVNGERTTRKKKIIKKVIEGAPAILTADTYFWRGCQCHGEYRTQKEFEYVYDVAKFFADKGFDVEMGEGDCPSVKFREDIELDDLEC